MQSPWKYFALSELQCKCGECPSTGLEMDAHYMECLIRLRERYAKPIILSSAYRCPAHNRRVSNTGPTGPHTLGKATDKLISGEEAKVLLSLILLPDSGFTGIGIKQKGDLRFIHTDTLTPHEAPRPTIWSY